MSNRMYVCDRRVVVDGKLAAFEGQLVSEAEATELGLLQPDKAEKPKAPTVAELKEQAKNIGVAVPAKATAADLKKLLAEALANADANAQDGDSAADDGSADTGEGADGNDAQSAPEGGGE